MKNERKAKKKNERKGEERKDSMQIKNTPKPQKKDPVIPPTPPSTLAFKLN